MEATLTCSAGGCLRWRTLGHCIHKQKNAKKCLGCRLIFELRNPNDKYCLYCISEQTKHANNCNNIPKQIVNISYEDWENACQEIRTIVNK